MKKTILSLFALAAMTGCSKNETPAPAPQTDGMIRVYTGIENPETRAVITQGSGQNGVQFLKKDGASAPASFADVTPLAGNIAATSGAVSFTTPPTYNKNNQNAYLVAYYPAGTLASNVVTWTIDGQTDILRTNAVWSAGNYVTPLNGSTGTKLILNHQLSQVEVVCKAEGDGTDIAVVRAAWGKIKSVAFVGAPTAMTYALGTLAVANGTTKADKALMANYNGTSFSAIDLPASTNTTSNAMAMLTPVPPSTNSFQLKVVADGPTTAAGDDITKTIDVNLGGTNAAMTAGQKHAVTLTFKASERKIDVTASTIKDWETGKTADNDVTI